MTPQINSMPSETALLSDSPSIQVSTGGQIASRLGAWRDYATVRGLAAQHADPRWAVALSKGLGHHAYLLESREAGRINGVLALVLVKTRLFGRFLTSLPYINTGGAVADDPETASKLIDRAAELADVLDCKSLELRHEVEVSHPLLNGCRTDKVHMRLDLPSTVEDLWNGFKSSFRTKIRKGEKQNLSVSWGRESLLDDYYKVFAHNMRDLGTPVFSRRLFRSILEEFPDEAELCVVRLEGRAIAAALQIHKQGATEIPSSSSLREFRSTYANTFMYYRLLSRAIERGQNVFDFGRSTPGTGTYDFKKQWGAVPSPTHWQYYVRKGTVGELQPNNPKYRLFVRAWRRLPVPVTRWLGPPIVRGIP